MSESETGDTSSEESYVEIDANNNSIKAEKLSVIVPETLENDDDSGGSVDNESSDENLEDPQEHNDENDMEKTRVIIPQSRKNAPPYQVMVDKAIAALNERKGSSVPAIKKYICMNFNEVNPNRVGFWIYKYLKKAVLEGKIKQIKMKYKLVKEAKKNKAEKPVKLAMPRKRPVKTAARKTAEKVERVKEKPSTSKQTNSMIKKSATKIGKNDKNLPIKNQTNSKSTSPAPKQKGRKMAANKEKKATDVKKAATKEAEQPTPNDESVKKSVKPHKKLVAKPTLKIVRKSLSLAKKKPPNKKKNDNSKAETNGKPTVAKRQLRVPRNLLNKAN